MTTAAYRTSPPANTHDGVGPLTTHLTANQQRQQQGSNSNDTYNIKQQPKYYLRDKYDNQLVQHQNDHSNSQTPRLAGSNENNGHYTHPPYGANTDRHPSNPPHQTLIPNTSVDPPVTAYYLLSPSEANSLHSTQPLPNYPTKSSPSGRRRSISHSDKSYESNSTTTRMHSLVDMQKNKSNVTRGTASRPSHGNYNAMNTQNAHWQGAGNSSSDGRESDVYRSGANVKQSHLTPNYGRNRRDYVETADNSSSFDENNSEFRSGHQPRRRARFPETTRKYNSSLPPVRRGQGPAHYVPNINHSLPPGHPLRGRYDHNDGYLSDPHSTRHQYANGGGRRGTTRSQNVAANDYEEEGTDGYHQFAHDDDREYEHSQQDQSDHANRKSHISVHEAPYLQQSLSTDSYLENQRRRTLRDSQGYYFPYKKYTLRDYKDLQRTESQFNPYGSNNITSVDRRALVRRRIQYAARIEKPAGDEQRTPRVVNLRKPPYMNYGANYDPAKAAKRNRALEYVKVQVAKHRPDKSSRRRYHRSDPTEEYINGLFPEVADFHDDDDDDDDADENDHNEERPEVHTETSKDNQIHHDNVDDDGGPK